MSGFVDEAQLHVKAGNGGAGAVSFRREAHVPKGGPDGGDGGSGGDVWLVADANVSSLLSFRDHPHREATSGTHGSGKGRHGSRGQDFTVTVPVGTVVRDRSGSVLADLSSSGMRWMAARGGRGGRGNARFLSNRRRVPTFAEQGEVGEEHYLNLELRLMADVALVGFPNAGKSTLISAISAAKPKVAGYPFTTLEPHLGVVRYHEHEFVVADIPGLIEGASEGKGLGHQFLKHIERALVLVILCDLAQADGTSPRDQEKVLLHELEQYRPQLLERPRITIATKADTVQASSWTGLAISAATGDGLERLLGEMAQAVEAARAQAEVGETFVIHRPTPEGLAVTKIQDGVFRVTGQEVERAVAVSDINDVQALSYVQHQLDRLKVSSALRRAGVKEGDVVQIAGFSFNYEQEG